MLKSFPVELLENITNFLDIKDTCRFSSTCKYLSTIYSKENSVFWKRRCNIDYNDVFKKPKKITWYDFYKKLYITRCIECSKQTKNYNTFYNKLVCSDCERNTIKYMTICQSDILKEYCLNKKDIENLRYQTKHNFFCKSRPIKLYLLEDVCRKSMEKYRTVDNLKIVKNEKKRKKIQKKLRGAVRFLILKNILRVKYDICIFPLLNNIQYYSESKFTRYINGSKIISSEDIVDYFLELNFIKKFGCTNDLCVWKNDTHRCLLFTLLMNKDVCINILPLSFKKKAKLLADIYPERFERKEKLIKKFEEYNILGRFDKCYYKFYDYIYNSDGNIDQIVDSEVISEFIDNNIPEEYCNDYVSNTTILQEWFFDIKTKISENTLNKILCSSPIQVRKILEKYC